MLVALRDERLDFGSLASPSRSPAAAGITIYYTAFDLRGEPWHVRRGLLE